MKFLGKMFFPALITFMIVNGLVLTGGSILRRHNINGDIIIAANLLFLLISALVFFIQKRSLSNANPNVFVRSVIAGMMIKMFTVVIAVLAYVLAAGTSFDKKAVFISLFIYLIYLAAEVSAISGEIRKKNV